VTQKRVRSKGYKAQTGKMTPRYKNTHGGMTKEGFARATIYLKVKHERGRPVED